MKVFAVLLLLAITSIDCRKNIPINKNANIDFINMEGGGGGAKPVATPALPALAPGQTPTVVQPSSVNRRQGPTIPGPAVPPKAPVPQITSKPVQVATPIIAPTPVRPVQPGPSQSLKPVGAGPAPGGNVQQLVTFYDTQGKASQIRPYSYSQAVKQG